MGVVCSECNSYEQSLDLQVLVTKENFVRIQKKQQILQQIKHLALNDLHLSEDQNFYYRGPSTYFIGQIQQALESSYGILYKPQKTLYYGFLKNGLFEGKGVLSILSQNLVFQGDFKDGIPDGTGMLYDTAKNISFTGTWNHSNVPNSGVLRLNNNDKILKVQLFDFQRGNVEILYKNGSVYKGFIDRKTLLPHGLGKMDYVSGDSYDGEWADGYYQGLGIYKWKDGQIYNGEYSKGIRNGEGTLYFTKDVYFTGTWKDGQRDGMGQLVSRGKISQKAIYRNNKAQDQININLTESKILQGFNETAKSQYIDRHI